MDFALVQATVEDNCSHRLVMEVRQEMPPAYWFAWANKANTKEGQGWVGKWIPDDYQKEDDGTFKRPPKPKAQEGYQLEIEGHTGHQWLTLKPQKDDWRVNLKLTEPLPVGRYLVRFIERPSKFGGGSYISGHIAPFEEMVKGPVPTAETMGMVQEIANGTGEGVRVGQQTVQPVGSETAQLKRIAELEAKLAAANAGDPALFTETAGNQDAKHPDSTDFPF